MVKHFGNTEPAILFTGFGKEKFDFYIYDVLNQSRSLEAVVCFSTFEPFTEKLDLCVQLLKSKVSFYFMDYPDLDKRRLAFLITYLQYSKKVRGKRIKLGNQLAQTKTTRTKGLAGMDEKKRRHIIDLGSLKRANKAIHDHNNKEAGELIYQLRLDNESYNSIAKVLNEKGYTTSKGSKYYQKSVIRLEKRIQEYRNNSKVKNTKLERYADDLLIAQNQNIDSGQIPVADLINNKNFEEVIQINISPSIPTPIEFVIIDQEDKEVPNSKREFPAGVSIIEYNCRENIYLSPGRYYIKLRAENYPTLFKSCIIFAHLIPGLEDIK